YWVPGAWIMPPGPNLLWTPGYWSYRDGEYAFQEGYWAPEVGFYGGIDYGAGYYGEGYDGARWAGGRLQDNQAVTNVGGHRVHDVYRRPAPELTTHRGRRVSFVGPGGSRAVETNAERGAEHRAHRPATEEQRQLGREARNDPQMHAKRNGGHPPVMA